MKLKLDIFLVSPFCKFSKFEEVTLADMEDTLRKVNTTCCERGSFLISDIKKKNTI